MVSINPAFQVLVVSANSAAIAAGSTVDQLAPGQIGFFSYATNLAIDGTVPSANKSFYMAVGVDRLAAGTIQDVNKSAGASIETKGIRAFTAKPYIASQNKKIVLTVGKVQCATEYGIKFDIRSELAYRNYGFNTPSKTFFATADPCTDVCVDCAQGDSNSVVIGLAQSMLLDADNLFTTQFLDPIDNSVVASANVANWRLGINALVVPTITATPATTGGTIAAGAHTYQVTALNAQGESLPTSVSATTTGSTGSVVLDWADVTGATSYRIYDNGTYFTSSTSGYTVTGATGTAGTAPVAGTPVTGNVNANTVLKLEITVVSDTLRSYSQINLNYLDPRQVNVIMSVLSGDFGHNGGSFGPDTTQATTQALIYEDGAGYDLQQLEYVAGGWNGKPGPYRVSELIGVAFGNFETFATTNGQYNVYSLTHENTGIGGGHKYQTSLMTIVAIPTANTTALNSVNAILHRLVDAATGNDGTVNGVYPVANAYNLLNE